MQAAEAGPAPEVGDDHAPARDLRRHLGQHGRDVLVRQAVEAVALHAGAADLRGQGDELRHRGLAAVERGVEAGDLRHAGEPLRDRLDGGQVVRLVQGSQRHQLPKLLQDLGGHDGGTGETRAPPCTTRCPTPSTREPP